MFASVFIFRSVYIPSCVMIPGYVLCSTLRIGGFRRTACDCQYHSLYDMAMWSGFCKAPVRPVVCGILHVGALVEDVWCIA